MRALIPLLLVVIILGCVGQEKKVDPKEILKKAENAVAKNFDANATFEMILKSPKFKDYTRYDMRIVKIGNSIKIFFLNYEYNTTSKYLEGVHRSMKVALRDAWILDVGSKFYLYTPHLEYMKDKVGEYKPSKSLPRYVYLPIVTTIDLARNFDKARKVKLYKETEKYYIISYSLEYPTITFAENAEVKVWISKRDFMPVKAEISAKFKNTSIKMVTEANFRIGNVKCDMTLDGLSVVKR